jgi:RNA polymerase sigma-70 factor, ECF subfamily
MAKEHSPEFLLQLVAREDVAAFGELFDMFAPRVNGLIAHILSPPDDAEEVLQTVFLCLWNESDAVCKGGGSVAAWLMMTARAVAIDALRSQHVDGANSRGKTTKSTGGKRSGKDGHEPKAKNNTFNPAWLPDPKAIEFVDGRLGILHKAVNQLPAAQREALDFAVFGGLSETAIAARMSQPLGQMQRSLRAAVTFVKHRCRAVCGTWTANI